MRGSADGNGWDHVYDLSYFFGFFVSGLLYWALMKAFPTKKQRGRSPFVMELHAERRRDATSPARVSEGSEFDGYVVEDAKIV